MGLILGVCLGWVLARVLTAWSEIPAGFQHPSEIAPFGCYADEDK